MILQPGVRKLGMVGVIGNERQFAELMKIVEFNKTIIQFDLSWNRFRPRQVAMLIEGLSKHS